MKLGLTLAPLFILACACSAGPDPVPGHRERSPATGSTAIACHADEPGKRLLIEGVVTDREGRPIEGAQVSAYNVDATGRYTPPGTEGRLPRVWARVTTDARGRFQVLTVHPAAYPDGTEPAHVHFDAVAPMYRLAYATIWFEGDPLITPERRARAERDAETRIVRVGDLEGLPTARVTIVLDSN